MEFRSKLSQLVVISWKINRLQDNRLCQYRIYKSMSMQTAHSIKDIKIGLVSRQKPLTKEKGTVKTQPGIPNSQNRNGSTESMGYLPLRRKPTLKTESSSTNHNTTNTFSKQVVDHINLSNPFVKLGGNIQSVTQRKNYCFHEMEDSSVSCLPIKAIINSKSSQAPPTVCSTKENQRERERETSPFGRQMNSQANFPIIQQVLQILKTKHLPNLINRLMKDIYDDFSHLRMEFKSLKDGVDSQLQKQEWLVNEIKNNQAGIVNNNNTINRFQLMFNQTNLSKTADITNLKSQLSTLNSKYEQIEMKMNDNFDKIEKEIHQIGLQVEQIHFQPKLKRSLLRTALSPLLVQYKQSFAIKKSTLSAFNGIDQPNQIAIASYQFLIDYNGYLMDSQGYYLVDRNGQQLQLDEKHIKQLEEHGILMKNLSQ